MGKLVEKGRDLVKPDRPDWTAEELVACTPEELALQQTYLEQQATRMQVQLDLTELNHWLDKTFEIEDVILGSDAVPSSKNGIKLATEVSAQSTAALKEFETDFDEKLLTELDDILLGIS